MPLLFIWPYSTPCLSPFPTFLTLLTLFLPILSFSSTSLPPLLLLCANSSAHSYLITTCSCQLVPIACHLIIILLYAVSLHTSLPPLLPSILNP